ncbi:unknown [Prevotella sp. CAG:1031]|nr:unknown [Prevotella sp. CAG:1031]
MKFQVSFHIRKNMLRKNIYNFQFAFTKITMKVNPSINSHTASFTKIVKSHFNTSSLILHFFFKFSHIFQAFRVVPFTF